MEYHRRMERWRGFGAKLSVSQFYETTITDSISGLSAHFVVVPSRSLGGDSYRLERRPDPLEALGLLPLADVPAGGVVRSLAGCLTSTDADEFMRRFDAGFAGEAEHPSVHLPPAFAFAEYLTFARVVPFEWSTFSADSLGNVLTAQGFGEAAYAAHEDSNVPVLVVAIPAGILVCGSTKNMENALETGMRRNLLGYTKAPNTDEERSS